MSSAASAASENYENYSYDRWGDAVPSQAGYIADRAITGEMMGTKNLSEPADMYIADDGLMYIAVKLNNRIVVTDLNFDAVIRIYDTFDYDGETLTLKNPQGVFVDDYTGFMYICDTENNRVIKCDKEGKVERLFTKPDNSLYGAEITYEPFKVCVDEMGNVYVVARSVNRGAIMFDKNGEFLGYFGANTVMQTAEVLANAFWNLISTEEQMLRSSRSVPVSFSNFDIDGQFIYTVTENTGEQTADQLKKLNPRGDNVLDAIDMAGENFGDIMPAKYNEFAQVSKMRDVDIGDNGEMNILDYEHGRIHQFDKDGYRLFIMGGEGTRLGTFTNAVSIESHGDRLYVLDSSKNTITEFKRTVFGEIVTEAMSYYNRAEYSESKSLWETVLKYDGNYVRAYVGIGLAYLFEQDYETALGYFEIAISRYYYNEAFEGYRNAFLKKNFTVIIIVLVVLIIGIYFLRRHFNRFKMYERGV
jgi:DNA-binding beta-propeller fold protein YncE